MAGGLPSRFERADDSAGLLLWQVTNQWQAAQRAALKPFGLTHVQFVLLASLAWLGERGSVRQRDLADHAATDAMMTSQVLRTLEAKGWVVRAPHPGDGRAVAVRVTEDGVALVARANAAVEHCDQEFFEVLGPAEDGFCSALRSLRRSKG